jgi:hypothetical protein
MLLDFTELISEREIRWQHLLEHHVYWGEIRFWSDIPNLEESMKLNALIFELFWKISI